VHHQGRAAEPENVYRLLSGEMAQIA